MRAAPGRVGPSHAEIKTSERIAELHHREELMWRQRSRVQWLSKGDKNIHFFHQHASRRKKKNKIDRLVKPDGDFTDNPQELSSLARDFYSHLYESERMSGMENVLNTVARMVTSLMNDGLVAAYTDEEVKTT